MRMRAAMQGEGQRARAPPVFDLGGANPITAGGLRTAAAPPATGPWANVSLRNHASAYE
jgi:hypothetical protein